MVFQGLVVMPLYVGYDLKRGEGRIFKYDITGGRYEESDYHAIGSGEKTLAIRCGNTSSGTFPRRR